MKSKLQFESQEYTYFNPEKNQFFSISQNCLFEIRKNLPSEIAKYKCSHSLYNLSRNKRISGLYETAKNPLRMQFDYMGEVYLLEVLSDSILIQFLYNKDFSPIAKKGKTKESRKSEVIGLW